MDLVRDYSFEIPSYLKAPYKAFLEMKKDIKNICATTKNIETISLEIAENTKISAWSSTVLATQVADYQSEAIRQTNKI